MDSELGLRLDMWSKICNATLSDSLATIMRECDKLMLQITTKGDDFLSNSSGFDRQCTRCVNRDVTAYLVTSTIEMRITVCRHHCYGPG